MSLSLVWTVLHMFENAGLLDTELVSLRYALCFWCFSSRSPWIFFVISSVDIILGDVYIATNDLERNRSSRFMIFMLSNYKLLGNN